jgi:hypothetical protein
MFTNCPYCGYLVALDGNGQPLLRCPNCAQRLRDDPAAETEPEPAATDAASAAATTTAIVATPAAIPPAAPAASTEHAPAPAPAPLVSAEPDSVAPLDHARGATPDQAAAAAEPDPPTAKPGAPEPTPPVPASAPSVSAAPPPAAVPGPPAAAPARRVPRAPVPAVTTPRPDTASTAAVTRNEDTTRLAARAAPTDAAAETVAQIDAAEMDAAAVAAQANATDLETDAAPPDAPLPAPAAQAEPPRAASRRRSRTAAAALPSFARPARPRPAVSRKRRLLEGAAVAGLSLLLAVQLLLAERASLASDARWRPALTALCAALQCTLPPWREPDAFHVLQRDIRTRTPGVLRVSAQIRNDARWPQPWPTLRLTLSDAHGRAVALRDFLPRDYLGGAPAQAQLSGGQTASLSMDIVEPGTQAVAFTLDFE